jgi:hypothetical protein
MQHRWLLFLINYPQISQIPQMRTWSCGIVTSTERSARHEAGLAAEQPA